MLRGCTKGTYLLHMIDAKVWLVSYMKIQRSRLWIRVKMCGVWRIVCGVWRIVCGVRCVVCGEWHGACSIVWCNVV